MKWLAGPRFTRLYYGGLRHEDRVRGRLLFALVLLVAVCIVGTVGYWFIGGGQWSVEDCAYMVLITITSVGYSEVLPVSSTPQGRLFTMVLVVGGVGVSLYFLSALTAFIIEGDLREALWRRRMNRRLERLSNHYIVCGVGRTGRHVVSELIRAGHSVVIVEQDKECLDRMLTRFPERVIAIRGDATQDAVLKEAGLERAKGIVAALAQDQDNLYVALTARQLNARLRIVSRGNEDRAAPKLRQAGADAVVSPTTIGGRRLAHELLHPSVVGFLDIMAGRGTGSQRNLSIEQVSIPPGSPLVGRQLVNSKIREVSNALVLAVIEPETGEYTYNPPPNITFAPGMTLLVLGEREQVARLEQFVSQSG